MAVDWDIGSAGPGRADGRAEGHGRKGRFERQSNDVHRCSQKQQTNLVLDVLESPKRATAIDVLQNLIFGHGRLNTRARGQDDGSSKQTPSNDRFVRLSQF